MVLQGFEPNPHLRNNPVQTVLNSLGPKSRKLNAKLQRIQAQESHHLIDCGKDARLIGAFNRHWILPENLSSSKPQKQVILLHGWEGSYTSSYIISATEKLLKAGYDVFRLNLRDHGPSLHLNRGLFNSTLSPEVARAILKIRVMFPRKHCFLAGFSLGGNFALRISADVGEKLRLSGTLAICPPVNPATTMKIIERRLSPYQKHYYSRWKQSLTTKLQYFPDLGYNDALKKCKNTREMNKLIIPNFTPYHETDEYSSAYTIDNERLKNLKVPTWIIASQDDPIVPVSDVLDLRERSTLSIETPRRGGHCGFMETFDTNSWVEDRMVDIFNHASQPSA